MPFAKPRYGCQLVILFLFKCLELQHSLVNIFYSECHSQTRHRSKSYFCHNEHVCFFVFKFLRPGETLATFSTQQLATLLGPTFCICLAALLHVRSIIEDFFRSLHTSYRVKLVCECQSLRRDNATDFNSKVGLLTQ